MVENLKVEQDQTRLLEIHKLANMTAQAEYRDHTISMYDVETVPAAEEEYKKRQKTKKQEAKVI